MKSWKPTLSPHRNPTRRGLLAIYRTLRKHYGHRHWWPGETPFEVVVGAILTQNAAWRNVARAISNLKQHGLLNPQKMRRVPIRKLTRQIRPAGYFNVKTKRLLHFLTFLNDRYAMDLKKMFKTPSQQLRGELLAVNGIGEETADSILLYAGEKPSFVVDTYTRRVLSRHRYVTGQEKYQDIQKIFTALLPKSASLYNDFHAQIVEVGKDYCRTTPRCANCPLRKYL